MAVGGHHYTLAALSPEKRFIAQEHGWAPGAVWTGTKNLDPPMGFDPRTVHSADDHNTN